MATGTGSIEVDFGAFPGSNEATVSVTGLTGITSSQSAEAWIMYENSTDHTSNDQAYVAALCGITCGVPVDGVGFSINVRCTEKLQGKFKLRYVWA